MNIRRTPRGYRATIYAQGRRWQRTFRGPEHAEEWYHLSMARLSRGDDPITISGWGPDHDGWTLARLLIRTCELWWDRAKDGDNRRREAQRAVDFFGATTDPGRLRTKDAFEYREHLISKGLANATINRHLSALSKMLTVANELGVVGEKPLIRYLPPGTPRDRLISDEEVTALFGWYEAAGELRMALLVEFLLESGCRFSEALNLEWKDVGAGRGNANGEWLRIRESKNGDPRWIPMTWGIKAALPERTWEDGGGPFHLVNKDRFRDLWKEIRRRMGLADDKQFVPHSLRHTCATRLARRFGDPFRVQKWMGHRRIETTMRYVEVEAERLWEGNE